MTETATFKKQQKTPLVISRKEWRDPLLFMLTLALFGLHFYPAVLLALIMMMRALRDDRYNFVIMALLFCGGYGLFDTKLLGLSTTDIGTVGALALAVMLRKSTKVKQTLFVWALYGVALLAIAMTSIESMSIQLYSWRFYMEFIFFLIPIACFAGREFDIKLFFHKFMVFALIMCSFYVIDTVLLSGNLLVPNTYNFGLDASTFYSPKIRPFSFHIYRKFPVGMYFVLPAVYPIARYFKLSKIQWAVFILAFLTTQTFTVIVGVLIAYVFFQGSVKRFLGYCGIAVLTFAAVYFIDALLPSEHRAANQSALRVKSSVDQVISLFDAVDEEDLSKFASGRMAQIIPKVEFLSNEHRQWIGLGFLHPEKTKINRYIIHNEYYEDAARREELAFGVECVPVQIYLTVGWLGLIANALFLFGLWWIIRRYEYAAFFTCTLFLCLFLGISGLAVLIGFQGLGLIATAYSAVILANRKTHEYKR